MLPVRAAWFLLRASRTTWISVAVPRLAGVGLAFVEIDAMVGGRWDVVRAGFEASGPGAASAAFAAVAVLAAADRAAVRAVLSGHAVIRRQPVPGWMFGPGVAALVLPVAAPALALGAAWQGPAGAVGWGAAAALVAVAASCGAWGVAALGVAGGAAAAALGPVGSSVAVAWVALAGATWRAAEPVAAPPRTSRVWGSGAFAALLHRDLLAVRRTAPAWIPTAVATAAGTAFVVRQVARGGHGPSGPPMAAMVCLGLASFGALAAATSAARASGAVFDPPRWPVRGWERAGSLVVLAGITLAPSWAAAACAAPMTVADHGRVGAYALDLAVGVAWWVAARPARPASGSFGWWVGACLLVAGWGGGPAAALVALGAWSGALRAVRVRRGGP